MATYRIVSLVHICCFVYDLKSKNGIVVEKKQMGHLDDVKVHVSLCKMSELRWRFIFRLINLSYFLKIMFLRGHVLIPLFIFLNGVYHFILLCLINASTILINRTDTIP